MREVHSASGLDCEIVDESDRHSPARDLQGPRALDIAQPHRSRTTIRTAEAARASATAREPPESTCAPLAHRLHGRGRLRDLHGGNRRGRLSLGRSGRRRWGRPGALAGLGRARHSSHRDGLLAVRTRALAASAIRWRGRAGALPEPLARASSVRRRSKPVRERPVPSERLVGLLVEGRAVARARLPDPGRRALKSGPGDQRHLRPQRRAIDRDRLRSRRVRGPGNAGVEVEIRGRAGALRPSPKLRSTTGSADGRRELRLPRRPSATPSPTSGSVSTVRSPASASRTTRSPSSPTSSSSSFPKAGTRARERESRFGVVESVKAVSDLLSRRSAARSTRSTRASRSNPSGSTRSPTARAGS